MNGRSHDRPFLNGQSCDRPVRRTNQPAALVFCMLEVHPTIRHQLFANTSRPAFGANPPSITGTTARHNLATSFTRALSEPKPNTTQQLSPSRAHELQVQTSFASDPQCQTAKEQPTRSKDPPSITLDFFSFFRGPNTRRKTGGRKTGGAERIRTDDPLLAKQVLSQLSYSPIRLAAAYLRACALNLVGQGRFELPTSRLSSARSNQLSY